MRVVHIVGLFCVVLFVSTSMATPVIAAPSYFRWDQVEEPIPEYPGQTLTVSYVTPNYEQDGYTCYLFGALSAMEIAASIASRNWTGLYGWPGWRLETERGIRLSANNLWNCESNFGQGGDTLLVFSWAQAHGLVEDCLNPYLGTLPTNRECENCDSQLSLNPQYMPACSPWQQLFPRALHYAQPNHVRIDSGGETPLQDLVNALLDGPVVASNLKWETEAGPGRKHECNPNNAGTGEHSVVLIGFDLTGGQDLLLVRNSQGDELDYYPDGLWISYADWAGVDRCRLGYKSVVLTQPPSTPAPVSWGDWNDPAISMCDVDADGDGLDLWDDNCRTVPNGGPLENADADGDGYGALCDDCPSDFNLNQGMDSDSDGLPDGCDDDIDGDGRINATDCHPYFTFLKEDMDDDGYCDEVVDELLISSCRGVCDDQRSGHLGLDLDACYRACSPDNCAPFTIAPEDVCEQSRSSQEQGGPADPECVALYANPDQLDSDDDDTGDRCELRATNLEATALCHYSNTIAGLIWMCGHQYRVRYRGNADTTETAYLRRGTSVEFCACEDVVLTAEGEVWAPSCEQHICEPTLREPWTPIRDERAFGSSTCQLDVDCGPARVCVQGRCANRCGEAHSPCPHGQICVQDQCEDDPSPAQPECQQDADCSPLTQCQGLGCTCVNSYCQQNCDVHADCGARQRCASDGVCIADELPLGYQPYGANDPVKESFVVQHAMGVDRQATFTRHSGLNQYSYRWDWQQTKAYPPRSAPFHPLFDQPVEVADQACTAGTSGCVPITRAQRIRVSWPASVQAGESFSGNVTQLSPGVFYVTASGGFEPSKLPEIFDRFWWLDPPYLDLVDPSPVRGGWVMLHGGGEVFTAEFPTSWAHIGQIRAVTYLQGSQAQLAGFSPSQITTGALDTALLGLQDGKVAAAFVYGTSASAKADRDSALLPKTLWIGLVGTEENLWLTGQQRLGPGAIPPQLDEPKLLFDAQKQRLYALGHEADQRNVLYVLDLRLGAWIRVRPLHELGDLRGYSLSFDPVKRRALIFGGERKGQPSATLRWLDLREPRGRLRVAFSGDRLLARAHHGAYLDSAGGKLYVYGGQQCDRQLGDLWVVDLAKKEWAELWADGLEKAGPGPLLGPRLWWNPVHNQLWLSVAEGSGRGTSAWRFSFQRRSWQQFRSLDPSTATDSSYSGVFALDAPAAMLYQVPADAPKGQRYEARLQSTSNEVGLWVEDENGRELARSVSRTADNSVTFRGEPGKRYAIHLRALRGFAPDDAAEFTVTVSASSSSGCSGCQAGSGGADMGLYFLLSLLIVAWSRRRGR